MRRNRIAHAFLAFLILLQSVSVLAAVPSVSMQNSVASAAIVDTPTDSSNDPQHLDEMSSCHGDKAVVSENAGHSCCESMEDAECMLGCASLGAAVPGEPFLESSNPQIRHLIQAAYAAKQETSSGLFRPPRTS